MTLSKKQATKIARLINDLELASDIVSRETFRAEGMKPDRLQFWMDEYDITVLALREMLGVHVNTTYNEYKNETLGV